MIRPLRIRSVRPLVRYVDREQAVIDTHICTLPVLTDGEAAPPADRVVHVALSIDGADGFHDEGSTAVQLTQHRGSVRFDLVEPERWWPAGMGNQSLYRLHVEVTDETGQAESDVTFGLTSVRRDRVLGEAFDPSLLVNGEICDIGSVVVVDKTDENQLLPATGDSLLLVRDHFGTDTLYEAADRAGILMVQCVPIDGEAHVEDAVADEVDRLASHPSLAGYFVGHLGELSDRVAKALKKLDPTRAVFNAFPLTEAA